MNEFANENETTDEGSPAVLGAQSDCASVGELDGGFDATVTAGEELADEVDPAFDAELQLRPAIEDGAAVVTITRAPRPPARPMRPETVSNAQRQLERPRPVPDPDPAPLLPIIATSVVEIIAGTRSVDQLAPVLSEGVYQSLRARAILENRTRALRGISQRRPRFVISKVHIATPSAKVVESVVLITSAARTRAVAIRLEQVRARWRATSLAIL